MPTKPQGTWILALDPPNVIAGRTELSLNSGPISLEREGLDWGQAAVQQYMAEQRYGQTPVSYRVPNRVITIKLGLGMENALTEVQREEARRQLQEKVALIQRQGGVLKRQRKGSSEILYADIVDAKLTLPDAFGEVLQGTEPGVLLELECLPDFYGEEVVLAETEENGQWIHFAGNNAGEALPIKGDYPARARIILGEGSGNNQRSVAWGVRSTYYSSGAEAALFFDAYKLTPLNGAFTGTEASAASGKALRLTGTEAEAWMPFCDLKINTGEKHFTHIGGYRVLARIKGTVGQKVRLVWSNAEATAPIENLSMRLAATGYQLVDLGEIRLEEPPVGEHFWTGNLQVETGPTVAEIVADRIWFQPLDDGAGRLRATAVASSQLVSKESSVAGEITSNNSLKSGTAWSTASNTVTLSGAAKSQALYFAKNGLSIPTGATVHGIEVQVASLAHVGPLNEGGWRVPQMQLVSTGPALVGESRQLTHNGSYTPGTSTSGGPSDMWGTTLTAAQISANAFGVAVWEESTAGEVFFQVTSVQIKIYYSFAGTTYVEDAVVYHGQHAELRSDGAFRANNEGSGGAYGRVSEETGDLPRLPPSGIENRPVQVFVKQSRGLMPEPGSGETSGELDAGATDNLKVKIVYRPCYLGRI
jgi:hypothetical protein